MVENLAVAWEDYQKNICNGFGALQQRGEFVDMTLAADGHHVKVHQMVMSLVSPYIKELITSAQCPHPVIFLNGVSYSTMQAILEYAYTGEVMISKEKIGEFLQACTNLHIRGLETMMKSAQSTLSTMLHKPNNERCSRPFAESIPMSVTILENEASFQDDTDDDNEECTHRGYAKKRKLNDSVAENTDNTVGDTGDADKPQSNTGRLQFSVSVAGNIQLVLNRYLFNLRHVRKDGSRFWRCFNQQGSGCPAVVTTLDDSIIERSNPHNHAFHDKQILKRVRAGNMFSTLGDGESAATIKKTRLVAADPVLRHLDPAVSTTTTSV